MNVSFYKHEDNFLWFIFDASGKTYRTGFNSKQEAVDWCFAKRLYVK